MLQQDEAGGSLLPVVCVCSCVRESEKLNSWPICKEILCTTTRKEGCLGAVYGFHATLVRLSFDLNFSVRSVKRGVVA